MKHYNTRIIIARAAMTVLALFCYAWAWAEDVTAEQALQQAQAFVMNLQTANGPRHAPGTTVGGDLSPTLTLAAKVSGLYVFNVDGEGGFVVVSNDDRTTPILGFGEIGHFDPDNMPSNMRAWLQGYADEIAWLQTHDVKSSRTSKAPRRVGTHSTAAIAPMVKTAWDQDAPYNNLCPTYYGSYRSATGCVATAMAQVMKYHEWPQGATTSIPGYTAESYNLTLSTLPAVTFDWANMLNNYQGNSTSAQKTAVATLMKYCGWSVQMDYGESSGAYTQDVATALREYFDYNGTTKYVSRSSYTYANWTDLIYFELAHHRPVVYGGNSTGGGHEFVCDGYKYESNTDFFHINWGWGGTSDNYFVLSALDPSAQGIGGSTSTDGFNQYQDAVIGIQKSSDNGDVANISPNNNDLSLNSMTLSSNPATTNSTVTITSNIKNNNTVAYEGEIYLGLKIDDGNISIVDWDQITIPAGASKNWVASFKPTTEGTYDFVICYVNGESETVTDGVVGASLQVVATNDYVPVYGYWTDKYSRSQFIIPAEQLNEMAGGTLNGVTFYATNTSVSWGAAEFDVYLGEVAETTFANTTLKDWESLEKVYSGKLSIADNMMEITFDEPYQYQGGNLLVGINQSITGSYSSCSWIGTTAAGASLGGYNTSISQQNFIPQTTFDYTSADPDAVQKPRQVSVAYTGGHTATVSWICDETTFDIDVNGTVTENVGNPYELTNLELATTYAVKVRAKRGSSYSDWTKPVSFTTDLAESMCSITLVLTDSYGDGWNGAAIKVVDVLTGTEIGTFANTNTASGGEAQNYQVPVPDDRDIRFEWVSGSYDDECSYAVYDVNGEVIFSGSDAMPSPVTYHVYCTMSPWHKPIDLATNHVTSTTAELSWTGVQDSYNVKYGKILFFEDFEADPLQTGWTTIDNNSDGYDWGYDQGHSHTHSGSGVMTSYSSIGSNSSGWTDITPDNWLITPLLDLQGTMSVWARSQQSEASYSEEHFAIYLSTTGTAVADFTITLVPETVTDYNWVEYTADLSQYAGQQGYIAIRHFNCYGQFRMNIDDFGIYDFQSTTATANTLIVDGLDPASDYIWQVQGNLTEGTTEWSDLATFTTGELLELADDAEDNSTLIAAAANAGKVIDVKLDGRTLYKDGKWNTICLPFDVTIDGSVLEGAIARELTAASIDGNGENKETTLNLTFGSNVSTLVAGTPYLIRWTSGEDIEDPVFNNVNIDATERSFVSGSGETRVSFLGNYDVKSFTDTDKESILLMGGNNQLRYANAKAGLGACRAYFQIGEDGSAARVTAFSIDFGEGDVTTGITSTDYTDYTDDAWYTLDGRKLEGKPAKKGVYISKGNKITIK